MKFNFSGVACVSAPGSNKLVREGGLVRGMFDGEGKGGLELGSWKDAYGRRTMLGSLGIKLTRSGRARPV